MFDSVQEIINYCNHIKLHDASNCLPKTEGIYFIIGKERHTLQSIILYIGQSENLKDRFRDHHRYQECINYDSSCNVYWLNCKNRVELEKHLINKFNPKLNNTPIRDKQSLHNDYVLGEIANIKKMLKTITEKLNISDDSLSINLSKKKSCPYCKSSHLVLNGVSNGVQRYKCKGCKKSFSFN